MEQIPVVSLPGEVSQLLGGARPISVLWQDHSALAFIARGREYRNEFHIDPSDEIIYVLKGSGRVH
ncbi:MAG TPA: 3-hydroxybutyryl-CoA dehydratase, partial [Chloroflexota bacterium]